MQGIHIIKPSLPRYDTIWNVQVVLSYMEKMKHLILLEVIKIMYAFYVCKKGKRKVQGVPQSQTTALPRPQEEEEPDKSKQAQTEQTYEKR